MKALVGIVIAVSLFTGCGAKEKNPVKKYQQGVLPHNTPPREQKLDQCAFTVAGSTFNAVEGELAEQEITVVNNLPAGHKNAGKPFSGNLILRGEPKGMKIQRKDGKFILSYLPPRGTVDRNQSKKEFEFSILPESQVNQRVQCLTQIRGVVYDGKYPEISVELPGAVSLDDTMKKTIFVDVKAMGLKKETDLDISLTFDKSLSSNEFPVYNLANVVDVVPASTKMNVHTYRFALEINPEKLNKELALALKSKKTEFLVLATVVAKNTDANVATSQNIVMNVSRGSK